MKPRYLGCPGITRLLLSIWLGVSGFALVPSQVQAQITPQKLTISGAGLGDRLGSAVAISTDVVALGAPGARQTAGAVYLFSPTAENWTISATLAATDSAVSDAFGSSVAVEGDTLVVGAPGDAAGRGSAYVFVREADTWVQQQKLEPSTLGADSGFGFSLALRGDVLVVGASDSELSGGPYAERAIVFSRSNGQWQESATLSAPDGASGDLFGSVLAVSESDIAVGASRHAEDRGAVYVFRTADFSLRQKVALADGVAGDRFGSGLAALPGMLAVGASGADRAAINAGATFLFDLTDLGATPVSVLPPASAGGAGFGSGIGAAGAFVTVAAASARTVSVFERVSTGAVLRDEVVGPADNRLDFFGRALAMSSTHFVVGAPLDNVANAQAGAAYLYALPAPTPSAVDVPAIPLVMQLGAGVLLAAFAVQRRGLRRRFART